MNSSAQKHFETIAKNYTSLREEGFIGNLVAKEKNAFLSLLPDVTEKWVLDLGCGSGIYTEIVQQKGAHVVALDFALSMAAVTKQKESKTLVAALENAAFTRKFDVVLCWGPLEFVQNQDAALHNIASLLKKEGILLILYPRRNFAGMLYRLYHSLLHRLPLTILSAGKFGSLLATNFIIEKQISVHVLTYALRCKKYK